MGIYIVKDLNNRTLLTVNFPVVSPAKTTAHIRSGDGRLLGTVLSGVWLWAEYFDLQGRSIGIFKPPAWPESPSNSQIHFQGKQRGALQIENLSNILWVRDTNSSGNIPLRARIFSGWTEEESRLLEQHAPPGQPYEYVIDGADGGRMLATGMAVFAYEIHFFS